MSYTKGKHERNRHLVDRQMLAHEIQLNKIQF